MSTMKNSSTPTQSPECIGFQEMLPTLAYGPYDRDEAVEDSAALVRHVEGCAWCQEAVALMRRAQALLRKSFDDIPGLERPIQPSDIFSLCEPSGTDVPTERSSSRMEMAGPPPASIMAYRHRTRRPPALPLVNGIAETSDGVGGCSLLRPDDPRRRVDPRHSEAVAALLNDVYCALQWAVIEQASLMELLPRLEESLHEPMSDWQRMHVWYALALSKLAAGDQVSAQSFLDLAVDFAMRLEDVGASIECAYWLGVISCELGQVEAAAEYFDIVLEGLGILMMEPETAVSFASYYPLMLDALKALPQHLRGE